VIVETGQGRDERSSVTTGGRQATVWLNRSADYVEHLDLGQIKTEIQGLVRTHPGVSLLMAGTAGLIIGSLVRRR
jgi:ElaB/YqjD/DUF883 family membrane-anchored ribosome-binding protein